MDGNRDLMKASNLVPARHRYMSVLGMNRPIGTHNCCADCILSIQSDLWDCMEVDYRHNFGVKEIPGCLHIGASLQENMENVVLIGTLFSRSVCVDATKILAMGIFIRTVVPSNLYEFEMPFLGEVWSLEPPTLLKLYTIFISHRTRISLIHRHWSALPG